MRKAPTDTVKKIRFTFFFSIAKVKAVVRKNFDQKTLVTSQNHAKAYCCTVLMDEKLAFISQYLPSYRVPMERNEILLSVGIVSTPF